MSDTPEEYRFLNNLAVMLDLGWEIRAAISAIRDDVRDPDSRARYDNMLQRLERGEEVGDILQESELIADRTSRLIIGAGQRSGMLQARLLCAAQLVRSKYQGGWDPYRRFLETWAVLVESGISVDEALTALAEDFKEQPLGRVADEFLKGREEGRSLYEVAQKYPEFFPVQACQLLRYGERRNMARALHSITQLV